jgi:hypothetical protein
MDWKCGWSTRASALQVGRPEFKTAVQPKKIIKCSSITISSWKNEKGNSQEHFNENNWLNKYYKGGNESSLNWKMEQLFWDSYRSIYRCVIAPLVM